jgi:hypothetical protein
LPDLILREEFDLSVLIPDDKQENDDDPIGQVLDSPAFQTKLLMAIHHVFQREHALGNVVVRLSR